MRNDDLPVLEAIQARLGIGIIRPCIVRASETANPLANWRVNRKAHCVQLVDIFERFPLRTKKANDLAVWVAAVRAWEVLDFAAMATLQRRLRATRGYVRPLAAVA